MLFFHLIEGILIGFLMAVPIGAVGILCIRRTLNGGRRQGYTTGLAGASADLVFSFVSASGIRLVSDFIADYRDEIRLAGGVILLVMGVLMIRSPRGPIVRQESILNDTRIYFSTFVLALTNPLVMFSYAAVLAMIGVEKLFQEYLSLSTLFAGVFLGSLLWFILISNLAHRFREKVAEEKLVITNRIAGALLFLIGLWAVWNGALGLR